MQPREHKLKEGGLAIELFWHAFGHYLQILKSLTCLVHQRKSWVNGLGSIGVTEGGNGPQSPALGGTEGKACGEGDNRHVQARKIDFGIL